MKILALFSLVAVLGFGQTEFDAGRKKPLWLDQTGIVRFDETGILFSANGDEKTRSWKYEDIQHFDRVSPTEFTLLSYEDVAWKLGRDRMRCLAVQQARHDHGREGSDRGRAPHRTGDSGWHCGRHRS